jgi:hypothetical protein
MFQPGNMYDKCMSMFLYEELALLGLTHGHNPCMMIQEFWFLLYNENFLINSHCVNHKSWVQDTSGRVYFDAK